MIVSGLFCTIASANSGLGRAARKEKKISLSEIGDARFSNYKNIFLFLLEVYFTRKAYTYISYALPDNLITDSPTTEPEIQPIPFPPL